MSGLGRLGLTNATKRSNDFRCPERARISWGKPCEVGVRGKDLILSRSGQRHIDALCVPNFNQRMYVGRRREIVPYRVAGKGREFFAAPKALPLQNRSA
jgi:hypothetical protein